MTTVGKLVFELSLRGNITQELGAARGEISALRSEVDQLRTSLSLAVKNVKQVRELAVAMKSLAIAEKQRAKAAAEAAKAEDKKIRAAERAEKAKVKATEKAEKERQRIISAALQRTLKERQAMAGIERRITAQRAKEEKEWAARAIRTRKQVAAIGVRLRKQEQAAAKELHKNSMAWAREQLARRKKEADAAAKFRRKEAAQQKQADMRAAAMGGYRGTNPEVLRKQAAAFGAAAKIAERAQNRLAASIKVGETVAVSSNKRIALSFGTILASAKMAGNGVMRAWGAAAKALVPVRKGVKKLQNALKKVYTRTTRFMLSLTGMVFVGSIAGIVVGRLIKGLFNFGKALYELAKTGASFNFIENSFKSLTGEIAGGAETLDTYNNKLQDMGHRVGGFFGAVSGQVTDRSAIVLRELQKSTFGMVDSMTLMQRWNQAVQLLGSSVAQDLPEVLGLVTKFAAATGRDVNHSMESIINGVARMEKRWLDNIGVLFDMDAALNEYAATIGKTADQLTEFEKRQAVMNKTLETMRNNLENVPDPTGTAVWAFARMDAMVTDLKNNLGKNLIPGFITLVEWLDKLWPAIEAGAMAFAGLFRGAVRLTGIIGKALLEGFGLNLGEVADDAEDWGQNIVRQLALGIIRGIKYVMIALTKLANWITDQLQPGSPPKILPDIDDWGRETAEVWIDGWSESRMGRFKKFASKIAKYFSAFQKEIADDLTVESRDDLVLAITTGKSGVDVLPDMLHDWANAVIDTEAATKQLAQAQDRLNMVTEKYEKLLRPISRELQVIADRQQAVADVQRAFELMQIVGDAGAPPLAKQLALMELRQIKLQNTERGIERVADAEKEAAQEEVDRMEKALDYAERYEQLQEDILDLLLETADLQNKTAKDTKEALEEISETLGGIGAGFGFELDLDEFSKEIEELLMTLQPEAEALGAAWAITGQTVAARFMEAVENGVAENDALTGIAFGVGVIVGEGVVKGVGEAIKKKWDDWVGNSWSGNWEQMRKIGELGLEAFGKTVSLETAHWTTVVFFFLVGLGVMIAMEIQNWQTRSGIQLAKWAEKLTQFYMRAKKKIKKVVADWFRSWLGEFENWLVKWMIRWTVWLELFKTNWLAAIQALPGMVEDFWDELVAMGSSIGEAIGEGLGSVEDLLEGIIRAIIGSAVEGIIPTIIEKLMEQLGADWWPGKNSRPNQPGSEGGDPSQDSDVTKNTDKTRHTKTAPTTTATSVFSRVADAMVTAVAPSPQVAPVIVNVGTMTGNEADLQRLAARVNRAQMMAGK